MILFNKQDKWLIKACKANERRGQEALYKLFYADMLKVCYRYLKNNDLAKEALNSGFFKVFQNINEFDSQKGPLGAWVRVIMIRTCIDLGRKEAKFMEVIHNEDEAESAFVMPEVLEKIDAEDLLKAIRRLPAATQLVFNLSVIEGYSHKEISEQLQIGDSTSRWHLTQAKKLLREALAPYYQRATDPIKNQNRAR